MIQPGFVPVKNELFDWIVAQAGSLTKREMAVLLVIIRRTIGFNQTAAELSCRFIEKATGINHSNISKALTSLQRKHPEIIHINKRSAARYVRFDQSEAIRQHEEVLSNRPHLEDDQPITVVKTTTEPGSNQPQKRGQIDNKYRQTTNKLTDTNKGEELPWEVVD